MSTSSSITPLLNSLDRLTLHAPKDYTQRHQGLFSSEEKMGGVWRVLGLTADKFVSASYDHSAKLWMTKGSGSSLQLYRVRLLEKQTEEMLSLARLDEESFLTGSSNGIISQWTVADGKKVTHVQEDKHTTGIYSIAVIKPQTIATGSCQRPKGYEGPWEHVVKIWDFTNMAVIAKLKGHTGGISSLVPIQAGLLASGSGDRTIRLWDTFKNESLAILRGHDDYVYGLTFESVKRLLISASKDKTARLWDHTQQKEVGRLGDKEFTHESTVYDVRVSRNDNNHVVTCSRDGYVKIWDLRSSNRQLKTLSVDDGYVYSADFLEDGKVIGGTSGIIDEGSSSHTRRAKPQNAHVVVYDFGSK